MKLSYVNYQLKTKHIFRISRSAHNIYTNTFVNLQHNDITGFGECAPSEFYGENYKQLILLLIILINI